MRMWSAGWTRAFAAGVLAVVAVGCDYDDLDGIPAGFADGVDNQVAPGAGLVYDGAGTIAADFEGSGSDLGTADTVARSDHAHSGLVIPAGTMSMFAGSAAPAGYLLCDGSEVSMTTYADLFAVIGTTYGAGDGSTTFNLPDMRGRVAVGLHGAQAPFDTLNKTGGEISHMLTGAELAGHNHGGTTGSVGNHSHFVSLAGALDYRSPPTYTPTAGLYYIPIPLVNDNHGDGQYDGMRFFDDGILWSTCFDTDWLRYQSAGSVTSGVGGGHSHGFTTGSTGGNAAHNTLQPYAVVNYIIKH